MASTISVPYAIVADSGISESNPREGASAKVKFKCAWDDRYQFVKDLMWSSVLAGPGKVIRTFPFAYPPSPNLYCIAIDSVDMFGKPAIIKKLGLPWLATEEAIVIATFGFLPFKDDTSEGKPFTTLTLDVGGEFLTFPNTTYRFADGTPTNTPIGKVIPQIPIVEKLNWFPYLPIAEMLSLVGKVNDGPYPLGDFVSPTGTLLFTGGPTEYSSDTGGNSVNEVEYRYIYRPVPWNYYMHPNRTVGFAPVTDGNGDPPYDPGDFTTLPH